MASERPLFDDERVRRRGGGHAADVAHHRPRLEARGRDPARAGAPQVQIFITGLLFFGHQLCLMPQPQHNLCLLTGASNNPYSCAPSNCTQFFCRLSRVCLIMCWLLVQGCWIVKGHLYCCREFILFGEKGLQGSEPPAAAAPSGPGVNVPIARTVSGTAASGAPHFSNTRLVYGWIRLSWWMTHACDAENHILLI